MIKIIFMSNGLFAVPTLKYLVNNKNIKINYIITSKKKYINNKPNLIKRISIDNNIKVIYSENIDSQIYINKIINSKPDFLIVISFKILKEIIWRIPKYGTINIHPSLLPQYKGSSPINWSIINGDKITGLTSFFINNYIDSGKIILQKIINIKKNTNFIKLRNELSNHTINFLIRTLKKVLKYKKNRKEINFKNIIKFKKIKLAPKINNYNSKIYFFLYSEKEILQLILGVPENKPAWCFLNTKEKIYIINIYKINIDLNINFENNPKYQLGKLLYINKRIFIKTKNNYIELLICQLNNKNKLNILDIYNGIKFKKDIFLF
ncbi:MAG: hypothetical protein NHF92_00840 [Candidatus Shikimatogenerans bostrichidophilus]|nr:MAG: hypothetical protein NHF92_00840 [Candidatus Shikimatogenerans bostrichidophilus]